MKRRAIIRNALMAYDFKAGKLQDELSRKFGINSSTVCLTLKKYYPNIIGGRKIRVLRAKKRAVKQRDKPYLALYGLTKEEYRRQRDTPGTMLRAFLKHRLRARRRNISFEMSFQEWSDIWSKSGKWHLRGVRQGQYVMCRFGDEGPYSPNNVFIDLARLNTSLTKHKTSGLPTGVCNTHDGKFKSFIGFNGKAKYLGRFNTAKEAQRVYEKAVVAVTTKTRRF